MSTSKSLRTLTYAFSRSTNTIGTTDNTIVGDVEGNGERIREGEDGPLDYSESHTQHFKNKLKTITAHKKDNDQMFTIFNLQQRSVYYDKIVLYNHIVYNI